VAWACIIFRHGKRQKYKLIKTRHRHRHRHRLRPWPNRKYIVAEASRKTIFGN